MRVLTLFFQYVKINSKGYIKTMKMKNKSQEQNTEKKPRQIQVYEWKRYSCICYFRASSELGCVQNIVNSLLSEVHLMSLHCSLFW